jgi:N-methylhydantoinase A
VMARAIKTISVERGRDPSGFTLMPFGGAGAMHACAVARELGIKRVLVPPSPGLLCAYGALTADVTHDRIEARTDVVRLGGDASLFDAGFARLEAQAHALLERDRVAPAERVLTRSCALRYRGQSFELQVPARGDLCAAFHAAHEERYGHALPEREVELCSLRVRAVGRTAPSAPPTENRESGDALLGRHTAIFGGRAHGAAIWSRRRLAPGARIAGPGIVIEYSATTVLPPDVCAEVHESGALLLEV